MKIELYKNANKLQKFLLLFKKENVEFRAGDLTRATHYRVLFGVKYITKEYRVYWRIRNEDRNRKEVYYS